MYVSMLLYVSTSASAYFFSQSYMLLLSSSNYMSSGYFHSGCRLSRFYRIQPHVGCDFSVLYSYNCCSCTPTNFCPPQSQPPTPVSQLSTYTYLRLCASIATAQHLTALFTPQCRLRLCMTRLPFDFLALLVQALAWCATCHLSPHAAGTFSHTLFVFVLSLNVFFFFFCKRNVAQLPMAHALNTGSATGAVCAMLGFVVPLHQPLSPTQLPTASSPSVVLSTTITG